MTDEFDAIRAGDEQAYEALFRGFYEPLCAFACRYLKNHEDAEDIVQNVFMNVWMRRANLPPLSSNARSFLFQAVRFSALNLLEHRHLAFGYTVQLATWAEAQAPPADRRAEIAEVRLAIDTAVACLTPPRRRVFRECVAGGRDQETVAHELHVSKKSVEVNSRRARLDLRKLLAVHAP